MAEYSHALHLHGGWPRLPATHHTRLREAHRGATALAGHIEICASETPHTWCDAPLLRSNYLLIPLSTGESVAFFGGGQREGVLIAGHYKKLARHIDKVNTKSWGYGVLDNFVVKQLPALVTWALSLVYASRQTLVEETRIVPVAGPDGESGTGKGPIPVCRYVSLCHC